MNGFSCLILEAKDANGLTSNIAEFLLLKNDIKVGNFSFTVEDLSIPMMGIPITRCSSFLLTH
jgi:hypothetical protein